MKIVKEIMKTIISIHKIHKVTTATILKCANEYINNKVKVMDREKNSLDKKNYKIKIL